MFRLGKLVWNYSKNIDMTYNSLLLVSAFTTGRGSLNVMTQNPANATIFLGDSRGRISIWSPNSREPLVDMFVHKGAVNGVAVDTTGTYMTTIGLDRKMRSTLSFINSIKHFNF